MSHYYGCPCLLCLLAAKQDRDLAGHSLHNCLKTNLGSLVTGSSLKNPAIAFLCAICLWFALIPQALADKRSREAVEALEAYAVYKMAMYDEAYARFMALAEKGNQQGMLNVAGMLAAGLGVVLPRISTRRLAGIASLRSRAV